MTKAPDHSHLIDWLKKAKSHGAHGNMMLVDNTPLSSAIAALEALPALLAAEREKALREVLINVRELIDNDYDLSCPSCETVGRKIDALIDTETDPQPDLSGTSEPQAPAHHIEDSRVMAEYACYVIDANSQCDEAACCDGRECGCGGETVHEHMKAMIRAKAGIEQERETCP